VEESPDQKVGRRRIDGRSVSQNGDGRSERRREREVVALTAGTCRSWPAVLVPGSATGGTADGSRAGQRSGFGKPGDGRSERRQEREGVGLTAGARRGSPAAPGPVSATEERPTNHELVGGAASGKLTATWGGGTDWRGGAVGMGPRGTN